MNCLCRSFPESWRCLARRRASLAAIVLATLIAFAATAPLVEAAPVTLQFDAIIGPPRLGSNGPIPPLPPSWNTSLQQGDTIEGSFTFEPFDGPTGPSKITRLIPFDFAFRIKTHTLVTSQFGIEVYNDNISTESIGIKDYIFLGCPYFFAAAVCAPSTVSSTDPTQWSFHWSLAGDSAALTGADIPADPARWQRLTFPNSMIVAFEEINTHKYYSFQCTPILDHAIPEPAAHVLGAVAMLLIAPGRNRMRKQGPTQEVR